MERAATPRRSQKESREIEKLYKAAFRGDGLSNILEVVSNKLPNVIVLLYGQDSVHLSENFLLHKGLDADASRSFAVDVAAQNLWSRQQWTQRVGKVYHNRDVLNDNKLTQTRIYKEWLSKWRGTDLATGVVLFRKETKQYVLEIRYSKFDEHRLRPLAQECLERLAPCFMRAIRIQKLQRHDQIGECQICSLLELISFPAYMIDADCRVHKMNAKGAALVAQMDSLFLSADGCLHTIEAEAESSLRRAINKQCATLETGSELVIMDRTDRQSPQILSLVNLGGESRTTTTLFGVPSDKSGCRLVLIAHYATEPMRLSHEALRKCFGLTSKESELAVLLLEGNSVGDIAAQRKVSKQTLRNQLCSLMRKTETARQPQLVGLLTRLAASVPA